MNRELQHLQAATKLFLDLTGGPSEALCQYLLKVIDFLEPGVDHSMEMNRLSMQMLLAIAEAVQERSPSERLQHSIAWCQGHMESPDAFVILNFDIQLALTSREEPPCLR